VDALRSLKDTRGPCPGAEALVAYGELAEGARSGSPIDAHVQVCSRCQLVLLHLEEPAAERRIPVWIYPLAAALVVAILLPLSWTRLRTPEPAATIRSADLQPMSPVGPSERVTRFEWQSPLAEGRYQVTVYQGAEVVWRASTNASAIDLPSPSPLQPGVEYTWLVEALDRDGDVRLRSAPVPFTIRR
jgi:hypothetical protein